MTVKQLVKLLKTLDQDAIIDIASDEEGNSFGDISDSIAEGTLVKNGKKSYSLYPETNELPEERFIY